MLIHQLLEASADRDPNAIALIEPTRRLTYEQLDRLANRFGHLFHNSGVRRGDRVVLAIENSVELVGAYLGALKAGAVAVALPGGPRSDRMTRAIIECGPRAAIVDGAIAQEYGDEHALASVPTVYAATGRHKMAVSQRVRDLQVALDACSDAPVSIRSIDLDLAAIVYTSGSTGEPKGVMLTHRNLAANTQSIVQYLGLTARDRVMCVLPLYYVYGLSLLHTHLAVGGSVVLDNRFAFPNVVLTAMRDFSVTGFAGVPSTFALLLHRSDLQTEALPSLRYVTQAGGAMAATRIQEWLARGPKAPFYVMYGATEGAARLAFLDPSRLSEKLGSIGRAVPNVEIMILREDGTEASVGEIGELIARGSNIASGYWRDAEQTSQKFRLGGYLTGDLGYKDTEGFIYLVGRMDDLLKVGAHRVGPREIEDILQELHGVHEAAVVGAPDPILGEVPVAFVSLLEGHQLDSHTLDSFCRTRLPAHKQPARFVILRELPKLGVVGKTDKARLRAEARSAASVAETRTFSRGEHVTRING